VITSDHGNELGGYSFPVPIRLYGHPRGLRSKNLVKVPWLISDSPKRKEITGEDMSVDSEHVDGSITDRLRALGYQE